jgi:hypothetical protein
MFNHVVKDPKPNKPKPWDQDQEHILRVPELITEIGTANIETTTKVAERLAPWKPTDHSGLGLADLAWAHSPKLA